MQHRAVVLELGLQALEIDYIDAISRSRILVHIYGKTDLNLNKNCGKSFMIHKNYQVMDADEEFTLTMVMIKIE